MSVANLFVPNNDTINCENLNCENLLFQNLNGVTGTIFNLHTSGITLDQPPVLDTSNVNALVWNSVSGLVEYNNNISESVVGSGQMVYVNKNGNDTTGNGSILFPFLTISKALSFITDASQTKVYEINVGPGEYDDNLQIKPWIGIIGSASSSAYEGLTIINSPSITLDASWAGPTYDVGWFSFITFQNNYPPLPYTFDFTTISNGNAQLTFHQCLFNVGVNFIGFGSGNVNNMTLNNCLSYGNTTVTDCQYFFTLGNTSFQGGILTLDSTVELTTWLSYGGSINSLSSPASIILNGSSGIGVKTIFVGLAVNNTNLTINGPNATYSSTIEGIPPPGNITNIGGTLTNLTPNVDTLSDNQTITGVKTFSTSPVISSITNGVNTVTLPSHTGTLVEGPASSTNNNLASFSGSDGQIIQDSSLASSNIATLSGTQTFTGFKTFPNTITLHSTSTQTSTVFCTTTNAGFTYVHGSTDVYSLPAGKSGTIVLGATSTIFGNLASFSDTSGTISDSGIASSNIPLLNGNNTFSGSNSMTLVTSGGTATALNYYEEGSFTATLSGIWASSQIATWKFVRVGTNVTLQTVASFATANTVSTISVSGLPLRLYPATTSQYFSMLVSDNGVNQSGLLFIPQTSGSLTIYSNVTFGNFSGLGASGPYGVSITYSVQ
jgi:hypothetical protein